MIFLTFWIAGQTAALCPTVIPSIKWLPSRMATLILTLVPLFWAIHVAVTRVEDYVSNNHILPCHVMNLSSAWHQRHHKEDVIVGSFIGIFSATVCYLLFWPSPFHSDSFNSSSTTEARSLYGIGNQPRSAYELTAIGDESVV